MEVTVIQGWVSKWGLPLVLRTLTFQPGRHLLRPCEVVASSWFCDPCHLLYHAKRAVRMEQRCGCQQGAPWQMCFVWEELLQGECLKKLTNGLESDPA